MAQRSNETELGDEDFENDFKKWKEIGSGGFGKVYKVRYKSLHVDVAIKTLHEGVSTENTLYEEASHMREASSEFVVRFYGFYKGGKSTQKGIVMDFMKRGSIQSLQEALHGPPPQPLVFRLAHQVALGINFLHSKNLVHHDLKPSNVLLTDGLDAKLTDFGLSKVSTSAVFGKEVTTGECGSYKYMPPEAFDASYKPVRAFDIYSYGILLWSIASGEEPYPSPSYTIVKLCIREQQQRPSLLDLTKAEGLKELVNLMKRCWSQEPSDRPKVSECCDEAEKLFLKHEKRISAAVHDVKTRLDSPNNDQHSNTNVASSSPLQPPERSEKNDTVDLNRFEKSERPSEQVSVSAGEMSASDKAQFVDAHRAKLIQCVTEVMAILDQLGDMVHPETYSRIEARRCSRDRMRTLYQGPLYAGGEEVKAAFYDALKEQHPYIVKRLGD